MTTGHGRHAGGPLPAHVILLRRLKVALVGAIIIPALLLVGAAWDERAQLLRAAERDALATVTALREHAAKAIKSQELLIRQLDSRLQGMGPDELRAASTTLSDEIEAMHARMPEVASVAVTDATGRRWAGSGPHERDGKTSLADREYFTAQREADQGTFISHAYVGRLSGKQNFGISRRRTTADGSFGGTIHVSVASAYFSGFWSQVTAGRKGVLVGLLRLDGDLLARLPVTGDALPLAMSASTFMQHVQEFPQGDVFQAVSASDGVERIYAYSRVGSYPLVVGYGVTVASAIAPWKQHLMDLAVVAVLVTAALVLAVLAAMRQVHRFVAEENRRLEIEQAATKGQRLELLGQLTAGIAHDFSNILQAMSGVASSLTRSAAQADRVLSLASRLRDDVERGAVLTQRMLDLVRQNSARGEVRDGGTSDVTDPAEVLSRICEVLPSLLGRGYQLRCEIAHDLPALARGNRSQLEMVIMNLAVNARDAMPNGGEILIVAAFELVGAALGDVRSDRQKFGLAPGLYVRLSVLDTGVGMSPEVLAQAGVLFFTTKPQGRGTGLGLAGARGFAERVGGKLGIESEEGHGTTVTLWLPTVTPAQLSKKRQVEQVR